mmetsp:Transcript_7172/g.6800  ORF Transcript_7172/g.6800 Transcript_7172/m.6800 type:complete len:106 (-) Transcript_7172:28-345(-)
MIEKISTNNMEQNVDNVDWSILTMPRTWTEVVNKVLHPQAAEVIFRSKMFQKSRRNDMSKSHVTVQDVISGKSAVELDLAVLEQWIDQEMFDVYSFCCLKNFVKK